jgi:hypothetical protein
VTPGTSRNASDPLNALLNYLYRLLEVEEWLAVQSVGLDPGLGVLHADTNGRSNFVLDLIDAVRPLAELYVLMLIQDQPLRWRNFHEDRRGVVRVLAPLTHRLAEAMPGFAATLAPIVERMAQMIAAVSPYDVANPSVLTKEKHRAAARRRLNEQPKTTRGDEPVAVGPGVPGLPPRKKRRQKPPPSLEAALPLPICKGCGVTLSRETDRLRRRGTYCPSCLANRREELGSNLPALAASARAMRGGEYVGDDEAATIRRKQANSAKRIEQATWESDHTGAVKDPTWFRSEVLPRLRGVTLTTIARATGMSTSAASKVRSGRMVPHMRHWRVLSQLGGDARPEGEG